jgi:methyl-accepting chemotaxis protein
VLEAVSRLEEMLTMAKRNAGHSTEANNLMSQAKDHVQVAGHAMTEVARAMDEIRASGQASGQIIKTVEEIAFQTNILALNAAVEAARAGQNGKGFAVVAEEVRNLAAKSAEAAKDTESLIANSIEKTEIGVQMAGETYASLSEIVSGINTSGHLVTEIAMRSDEQSVAIEQINAGIEQVAGVVQQNSATAEQSASASQEMSGQSDALRDLISQFKLKSKDGEGQLPEGANPLKRLALPQSAQYKPVFAAGGRDFGKY